MRGYLPAPATRVATAVAVTLAVATPFAQQPDQPAFRTGIDLVSLNVTVTDGNSRYVTDLEQASFQLYEDGALQDTTFFSAHAATDRAGVADRHEREHVRQDVHRAGSRYRVHSTVARPGHGQRHRLRQPGRHSAGLHQLR